MVLLYKGKAIILYFIFFERKQESYEGFFGRFFELIYIAGYFEKGLNRGEEFKAKPYFVLCLLKGSVKTPDKISFTQSAINGYILGDSIVSVVRDMKYAGYDKKLLAEYIEGMYETKHRNSKTYNERYGDKLYKDALYEKVLNVNHKIKIEDMSTYLAECFDDGIKDIISNIINPYSLNGSEKKTIINQCELIKEPLFMLKTTIDLLIEKSRILNVSQYGSDIYKKCDKEINDGIERLLLINSMLIDQNKLMPSEELKSIIEIIPYITKDKVINYKANCAYIDSIQISPIQIILKLLQ